MYGPQLLEAPGEGSNGGEAVVRVSVVVSNARVWERRGRAFSIATQI